MRREGSVNDRFPLPAETPDHEAAKAFGASIPVPPCRGADARASFWETWGRAAALGLFDLLIPRIRLDADKVLATLEGLADGCKNGGFILAVGAHCCGVGAPLVKFGADHHQAHLTALRDGSAVAALAATEPGAGSDVMALATRFQPDGDGYTIKGTKCFVTNVREADLFLVLATRDPRLHSRGVSAFLVPADAPGLQQCADEQRLGLHGCSIGALLLDQVRVSNSALLGPLDGGAVVFRQAMLWERSLIAAAQIGILRRLLVTSLARANARYQFQRPVGANQYVAGRIVDLLTRYSTSRLLVRDTVAKLAMNNLTPGEASLTKLYVSEALLASGLDAFRIQGGSAFLEDSLVGADVRNSLGGIMYSGTSDIQRVIVASELGLVS